MYRCTSRDELCDVSPREYTRINDPYTLVDALKMNEYNAMV